MWEAVVVRIVGEVRRTPEAKLDRSAPDELHARVRHGVAEACADGMVTEAGIVHFVLCMFTTVPGFSSYPGVRDVLRETRYDEVDRVRRVRNLLRRASPELLTGLPVPAGWSAGDAQ